MLELHEEAILAGTKNARENSWRNRYNANVTPYEMQGANLVFSLPGKTVAINSLDEVTLTIILKFLFMPVWLIKQFYHDLDVISTDELMDQKINDWIECGLIWKEGSVTGEYVRPTYSLFKLFNEEPVRYTNIPFNLLTHTICEEKVMFDIMVGISDINKKEVTMPRVSELGFENSKMGTNVIAEEDFRYPNLYKDEGIMQLSQVEHDIWEGMRNGARVTPELRDFKQFILVKKIDSTGTIKKDYQFHIPDMVIPVIRKENGDPQSIAVEVELSNKRVAGYEETMKRYHSDYNKKYGVVYWYCAASNVVQSLRNAFENVGGCGKTKVKIAELVIPSPKF